jgi:hypothetical protein
MEVYDEIAHNMETSRNSMCESKSDRYPSARMRVSQGYSTPSQGISYGAYWCVSRATRVGIPWRLSVHKRR